ncbi:MAG TPA: alpha/beta fold hydrolase [Streptosporangiaceae bacterium]|nr:alpha/beta fold hydrolase [Streptosporangiaceae bacterium]
MKDSPASPWFISRPRTDSSPARIFCFPHAGGSPRAFLDWQDALGADAEIIAICRPGREHRAAEPAPTISDYVDGAARAIASASGNRASYLVGHSLGAVIAFEVCKRLAGAGVAPHRFIASGCSAPCLLPSERVRSIARLSGREFAEAIGFFGGLSAEVIADDEMRELLLPGIIADFHMAVGYQYAAARPLDIPATVVVGRDDPHVTAPQAEPWGREFAEPVDQRWVDGGHFYFEPDPAPITAILAEIVRADQHVELI